MLAVESVPFPESSQVPLTRVAARSRSSISVLRLLSLEETLRLDRAAPDPSIIVVTTIRGSKSRFFSFSSFAVAFRLAKIGSVSV